MFCSSALLSFIISFFQMRNLSCWVCPREGERERLCGCPLWNFVQIIACSSWAVTNSCVISHNQTELNGQWLTLLESYLSTGHPTERQAESLWRREVCHYQEWAKYSPNRASQSTAGVGYLILLKFDQVKTLLLKIVSDCKSWLSIT